MNLDLPWDEITWHNDNPVLIRRVRDPYGWMGNMSRFKVEHEGIEYPSTEALFQCLRVEDEEVRALIRGETNAFKAKLMARKYADKRTLTCLSKTDLDNMRLCLRLKLEQHPNLVEQLLDTDDRIIIEDCSNRQRGTGLFWGVALHEDDYWFGANWLGVLWMEQRKRLRDEQAEAAASEGPNILDVI